MAKFRKKPVVIEALLWTGGNLDDVMAFCCGDATYEQMASGSAAVIIKTLEGQHVASVGDWIIRGINGEFYPCKPDIFEKTYEAVEAIETLNSACDAMWNDHEPLEENPERFGQDYRLKEIHMRAISEAQQKLPSILAKLETKL